MTHSLLIFFTLSKDCSSSSIVLINFWNRIVTKGFCSNSCIA
ncbi:hypothetical protein A2I42_08270 [Salmonella enterica]|uniref:Uncharacterized protein n=1 Tax=Salmonella enterica TaxID=28901 RepID=A0A3W7TMM0_SALER|nr:hypothetical protein [Salmonella enterica]EBW8696339.1 hypothetical protein [Salmonella enterica subsp. diarizonae serovar 16:z10:e,n,x,z15]EDD5835435.1 hypothetical protein [Salmonella enterica subsp. enterica serovar Enteritidis]EAB1943662.1 hypothetical protein [Salmonella enterica]EAM8740348.1 hypothetical protein [Salmonella enterica]